MYNAFFGFREKPFKLTPNPAYLFLSQSYEEALAHLRYAMSEGEGFFEITGEVGTGKTTLCRVFLESLDDRFEAAYVFNPKLDSIQLLKVINDELGIPSDSTNAKDLVDALNRFLLEKKAENRRVIIIVDEAQNLADDVLEQLRLLSNLETTTDKLLQIVLVGQPELREKLNSYALRQLGQRITLNLTLLPLTLRETEDYINHRIQIASRGQTLRIDRSALNHIFKYSKGIPRLINIVCDRMLLTAFSFNQHQINADVARSAIRELTGKQEKKWDIAWNINWDINWLADAMKGKKIMPALSLILLAGVALMLAFFISRPNRVDLRPAAQSEPRDPDARAPERRSAPDSKKSRPLASSATVTKPENRVSQTSSPMKAFLLAQSESNSRDSIFALVAKLWNPEDDIFLSDEQKKMEDEDYFRIASRQNGFSFYTMEWRLDLIRRLNLPAIFSFYIPEKPLPVYLALIGVEDGDRIVLRSGQGEDIRVSPSELESFWSGDAMLLWKNFLSITGTIPFNDSKDSILILKALLNEIVDNTLNMDPVYDEKTRQAIINIQRENGLLDDGVVGSLTKIALYNARGGFPIPHIMSRP